MRHRRLSFRAHDCGMRRDKHGHVAHKRGQREPFHSQPPQLSTHGGGATGAGHQRCCVASVVFVSTTHTFATSVLICVPNMSTSKSESASCSAARGGEGTSSGDANTL